MQISSMESARSHARSVFGSVSMYYSADDHEQREAAGDAIRMLVHRIHEEATSILEAGLMAEGIVQEILGLLPAKDIELTTGDTRERVQGYLLACAGAVAMFNTGAKSTEVQSSPMIPQIFNDVVLALLPTPRAGRGEQPKRLLSYLLDHPFELLTYDQIHIHLFGKSMAEKDQRQVIQQIINRYPDSLRKHGIILLKTGEGFMWVPNRRSAS